jgi:hypothetical protein
MRVRFLPVVFLSCLMPLAAGAQDKDNPYKKVKVGDYVTYKMTTSFNGATFATDMKQTVTARTDKEVTLKTTSTIFGKDVPGQTTTIDLTKPYDVAAAAVAAKQKGKFEKTGEGKEKIKVNGKEYDCNWVSGKLAGEIKGLKIESDVKVWASREAPMSGVVKMEMKSKTGDVVMELSGSGNEK